MSTEYVGPLYLKYLTSNKNKLKCSLNMLAHFTCNTNIMLSACLYMVKWGNCGHDHTHREGGICMNPSTI